MIAFMEGLREKRLKAERDEIYAERKTQAQVVLGVLKNSVIVHPIVRDGPYVQVQPSTADWYSLPTVKDLIERPVEEEIDFGIWAESIRQLNVEVEDWSNAVHLTLSKLISPKFQYEEVFFICSAVACKCGAVLFYPEVLFHLCATTTSVDWSKVSSQDVATLESIYPYGLTCVRRAWTAEDFTLDPVLTNIIAGVASLLGLDPSKTKAATMDEQKVYLRCIDCDHEDHQEPEGRVDAIVKHRFTVNKTMPSSRTKKARQYLFGWRKIVSVNVNYRYS